MKLKALRNFYQTDKKTGRRRALKAGEIFEMDETDHADAEAIYDLLSAVKVTVADEKFIPLSWRYLVVCSFQYTDSEGLLKSPQPRQEITLNQEVASRFLTSGHIRPVDDAGWTPQKLLGPVIKSDVKRMFDDPAPREPWDVRRGGH